MRSHEYLLVVNRDKEWLDLIAHGFGVGFKSCRRKPFLLKGRIYLEVEGYSYSRGGWNVVRGTGVKLCVKC